MADSPPRRWVESFRVQNYGCVRDATLKLTPLHALIGPNDSGKSTLLRALWSLGQLVGQQGRHDAQIELADETREQSATRGPVHFDAALANLSYHLTFARSAYSVNISDAHGRPLAQPFPLEPLKGAELLRLDPDQLRQDSHLIADGAHPKFFSDRGFGLPGVLDAIQNRDVESFLSISKELRRLFPTVRSLQLRNPSQATKTIAIELTSGETVLAKHFSEGLLYYLAFAVLPKLQPTALLMVEEPENGLHPARIKDVMRILREVSKTTQVLLATHSPLVVNELSGEEVSVVTRTPEEGTRVQRLSDTKDFAERSKVYAPGELWVSYADGQLEGPLLEGVKKAP